MRIRHLAVIAATGAAALAAAAPASAHTELESTRPAAGGSASTAVRSVTATFSQALRSGTLHVTGPAGRTASRGSGGRDPRKLSRIKVGVKRSLAAGRYRAHWTIRAADGHQQSGSFSFRLR